MDRRDNPETPNSDTDEQFQKAYEVISLSYKGDESERLYREAITCFDSLIEISHGNESISEFAQRRSIDMKYLVDGASFVISKMHFNPENNYYITLGLPQNVTPDELSRRWKKFMLLYHPDRQTGNEEWVSERAKKVNEAYTALKDETKRAEYDRRLTEQMMSQKFSPAYGQAVRHNHQPSRNVSRRRMNEESSGWNRIRPYMPKILIAVYVLIALIVLGFIYVQNRSAHLEAELAPEAARTRSGEGAPTPAVTALNTTVIEQNTPGIAPAMSVEPGKGSAQTHQEAKNSAKATSPLLTIKSWFQPRERNQDQEKIRTDTKEGSHPAVDKKEDRVQDNPGLPLIPARPSSAEQIKKEDPPQKQAEVQKAPPEPIKPLLEAKQQARAAEAKTDQITKEEVEEFMQRYISAYTNSDLNTFLSLFSRSAVENNTLTYNEMRNAYKETFSGKINHYKILNMDIRTDGQTATVSGIYNVNRYVSADDRWVRYSGKIVWKLVLENSQLRIIKTNYDK